ncbi:MAG: DUF5680 domain-containing protein [Ferroplasma sp.]|uniref:DUF5680 domain-containing protein n=1 Tax=Ferroplasma sp. TaxID=2591003 RepID=UPI002815B1D3|nr:DUF5680 domain-containing protein [Ferroplasma sp.]WMT51322.1 MAG: DUF5680 domain-containing protein [Ferroplasma sp.]
MDTDTLLNFIVSAKKHTYASDSKGVKSSVPGSHEFNFRDGIMEYRDIYFGMASFNGIETVYSKGSPVWGMVYSGGVMDEAVDTDGIYKFLKQCLSLISMEAPFRGPKSYSDGIYLYDNDFSGDIFHFMGYEKIDDGENTLYELHYSGGEIL